jgi:hypothetical protein
MKAFIAEVLLPEQPDPASPRLQYWAVLADTEELAGDALKRAVPHGSEVLLTDLALDEQGVKREGLQPGVPKVLASGLP